MRPDELRALWQDVGSQGFQLPAISFYDHKQGHYRSFSNFYEHRPFDFTVPEECGGAALVAAGRSTVVPVTFTEKAIMLCKAAVMGDYAIFDEIARARDPKKAKALGRLVHPWDQKIWDAAVCTVAVAVVEQKFGALPELGALLHGTGQRVIAEMTRNDANWGTGFDIGHADEHRPARWRGTNILGWALMVARERLRAGSDAATAGAAAAPLTAALAQPAAATPVAESPRESGGAGGPSTEAEAAPLVDGKADEEEGGARSPGGKAERKGRKDRRAARLQSEWLQPR